MANRYNVTIPRTYTVNGVKKTHFWQVGTAFPLKEHDGFSIKLHSRMLLTDEYVLFAVDEDEPNASVPVDDIPF